MTEFFCDVCNSWAKGGLYYIACPNCHSKKREQPPDATGIIMEFLTDWKWGRAYEMHFSWLNFYDHCRCKHTTIEYWKWFEHKWEERRFIRK